MINTENKMSLRLKHALPWVFLYLAIVVGAGTAAAMLYDRYEEYHLPSGYIELSLQKTRYELGEPIVFTITNHFPVPVYVTNQCPNEPLNVYRWDGILWHQLHARAVDGAECYDEERNVAIPSEGVRSYHFNDWPELFSHPGVYRIAAVMDHYSDIPFQDFVILEKPEVVKEEVHVPTNTAPVQVVPAPVMPAPTITFPTSVVEELREVEEEDEDEYEEEHEEEDEREHEEEEDDD